MKYEYEAKFRLDLGKAIPRIGDIINDINSDLSTIGCDEKLSLTSEGVIPPFTVTVNRQLTQEEEYKMKSILEAEVIKTFPKYDVRLMRFCCKSVTSEQAVQ